MVQPNDTLRFDGDVKPQANSKPQPPVRSAVAQARSQFGSPTEMGEVGTLGPYRLLKQLGAGGMGAVYLAIDTRLKRKLALKVMLPDAAADVDAKERFLREARAAAQISHDNVITVYEADERDGVPYIAMQLLQGLPLDELLAKNGTPSIPHILQIAQETAAGLAAAHRIGVVHRDVKPANLWLEAPHGRVKVLDFGLAKPVETDVELTKSGIVVGTPAFMSREQACGQKVDGRADLYSLGAVLYRLCTGRPPFEGATFMALLLALGTENPTPVQQLNPGVPDPLADLIHQLLAKSPNQRPQTADEVVERVRRIAEELTYAHTLVPMAIPVTPLALTSAPPTTPAHNPFADLTDDELTPLPANATPDAHRPHANSATPWLRVAVGLVVGLLMLVGGWVVTSRMSGASKPAPPTHEEPKPPALPERGPPPVAPAGTRERQLVEWVLSVGGKARINGETVMEINVAADLPPTPFALTSVILADTSVTDNGLAQLAGYAELERLDLARTKCTGAGLSHLTKCVQLAVLNLEGTNVTDANLSHLPALPKLWDLGLARTPVTDAGLAHLKGCKNLTWLNVARTAVTDHGLTAVGECKRLLALNLDGTAVTDVGLARLAALVDLRELILSRTKVTDAGLIVLRAFKDLDHLNVQGNTVTDAGLVHVGECKKLVKLDLGQTKVTDLGLIRLKGLLRLKELYLHQTAVTTQGGADYQKAVPNCRLFQDDGRLEPKP